MDDPEKGIQWPKHKVIHSDVFSHTLNTHDPSSGEGRPWRTSFLRFGPLSGIFSMFLALTSIVAALAILISSDDQPVSSWKSPPSTYLAIFTAIANLSARYSAIQGVIIAWWFRAGKGSTLSKLHWDWRSGTSLQGALTAGRHIGLLGAACLFSTIVVVDGPLLQRSSTVRQAPVHPKPVLLNVSMAQTIPTGYTGWWATQKEWGTSGHFSKAFNDTVPTPHGNASNEVEAEPAPFMDTEMASLWWNEAPISGSIQGCPTSCRAKLRGPALFATDCKSSYSPMVYNTRLDLKTIDQGLIAPPLYSDAFLITTNLVLGQEEVLNLATGYVTSKDCEGTLNLTVCTLKLGIGEYDVTVRKNKISMEEPLEAPRLVELSNNAAVNNTWNEDLGGHASTLAGIVAFMYIKWSSRITYFTGPDWPLGSSMAVCSFDPYEYMGSGPWKCPSYRDPREDVMQSLNKLMLYVGAHAGQKDDFSTDMPSELDRPIHYRTTGYPEEKTSVFHTDYWYFLAAALIETVCIVAISPTYWGWWRIGRPVSFSPLELAKCFESPLLANCNSNSSGRDLAEAVQDVPIRYGLMTETSKTKVAFGHPALVTQPRDGRHFEI